MLVDLDMTCLNAGQIFLIHDWYVYTIVQAMQIKASWIWGGIIVEWEFVIPVREAVIVFYRHCFWYCLNVGNYKDGKKAIVGICLNNSEEDKNSK